MIRSENFTVLDPCGLYQLHNDTAVKLRGHHDRCFFTLPIDLCTRIPVTFKNDRCDRTHSILSYGALYELALTCFLLTSNHSLFVRPRPFSPPAFVNFFDKFLSPPYNSHLLNLSRSFTSSSVLEFYTDGSLKDIGLPSIRMGLAWLQMHQDLPMVSFFSAFVSPFPS